MGQGIQEWIRYNLWNSAFPDYLDPYINLDKYRVPTQLSWVL